MRWLYRRYRTARVRLTALGKLARKEREWQVPLRTRTPQWWRRGFLSRSAVLYELDRNDPSLYLSDSHRYLQTKRMVHPKLQDLINNKLTTHLLLTAMDIPAPELLGIAWQGRVHRFPSDVQVSTVEHLRSMELGDLHFFKVVAGAEGKNIQAITRLSDGIWDVNGSPGTADAAARSVAGFPMIIERGIVQHPSQAGLNPGSVNTIRVLTVPDVADGNRPFIAAAVQRIGCRRSGSADNWSRGGLSAAVDLDTGVLGRATRLPDGHHKEWFDTHPDTGAMITGHAIAHWDRVVDLVLGAAAKVSFLEYVGWDIVITAEGPLVLEANINSGVNVIQSHQPLLADPRVRAYYRGRGLRVGGGVP